MDSSELLSIDQPIGKFVLYFSGQGKVNSFN